MIPTSPSSDPGGKSPDSSTEPVIITELTDLTEKPQRQRTSTTRRSTPSGSAGKGDFRPLVFLYRMLLGIFVAEAIFLAFSFNTCSKLAFQQPDKSIQEHCPRLGERAENLFGVSIATCLSLMTGQAVENFRKKKD